MISRKLRLAACWLTLLGATQTWAADPAPTTTDDSLVEKVVVRNRLYNLAGKWELGLVFDLPLLSRLIDSYNFNVTVAYNPVDWLAVELRAGYAISSHTSLANQIAADFASNSGISTVTDLSDAWEMGGNAVVGVRFQPIYGKISLMSELAVHFQFYAWLGAGAGLMHRNSLLICNVTPCLDSTGSQNTANYYTQDKVSPLVSVALGARFLFLQHHAIRLEVRDYSWIDSFLENVDRKAAMNSSNPTGNGNNSSSAGITNLSSLEIGYTYLF